jgi:glycosyltransferase involved in cell wall biosynthesis
MAPVKKTRNRRKRILITTDFYLPHTTGVSTYVQTLAEQWKEYDVTILTYNVTASPSVEKHAHITVRRLKCSSILGKTFVLPQLNLPKIEPHDIIITNTRFFTLTITGMRLANKWGVPHIHVEHGNRHVPHNNPLVRLIAWTWDQTIGRVVMHNANTVVCVSKAGVPFAKSLSARAVTCIPNAINPADYNQSSALREQTRASLAIPLKSKVVVFVGRLVREKGVQDLIEAMKNSESILLIVGDGPYRAYLENLTHEYHVRARFMGAQDKEGVRAALAAGDIFVNPSWAEGLPTSVLEALAAKLHVIATDVGGTAELLPKSHLVQPRKPMALRYALQSIAKEKKALSFPENYTAKTTGKAWHELLENTLEAHT